MKKILSILVILIMIITSVPLIVATSQPAIQQIFDGSGASLNNAVSFINVRTHTNTSDYGSTISDKDKVVYIKADKNDESNITFETGDSNHVLVRFITQPTLLINYEFQFSSNGTNWTVLSNATGATIVAQANASPLRNIYESIFSIPDGMNYFRVVMKGSDNWHQYRISEISFMQKDSYPISRFDGTSLVGLAGYSSNIATATSGTQNLNVFYKDEIDRSIFYKTDKLDANINFHTGGANSVSVRIVTLSNLLNDFSFQISNDGTTWSEYGNITWEILHNITGVRNAYKANLAIPSGIAQFRISISARDIAGNEYRISEVAFFGEAAVDNENVSLTKSGNDFIVGISNWRDDYKYQIWTYQKVQSGLFGDTTEFVGQWILSMAYTQGKNRTAMPLSANGKSIIKNIGQFDSMDGRYIVSIKVLDESDNFVSQYRTVYTSEEVGVVLIKDVLIDGSSYKESGNVKDISEGVVNFNVETNITEGIDYIATISPGNEIISGSGNSFIWDISSKYSGNYTVNIKVQNGETSSDEKSVKFNLYKIDETVMYGVVNSVNVQNSISDNKFLITASADIPNGEFINYTISEPWVTPFRRSSNFERVNFLATGISDNTINSNQFGIFQFITYVRRSINASADDGVIKTVENARPGTKDLSVLVDTNIFVSGTINKSKGNPIVIEPTLSIDNLEDGEQIQYSFWRRDARGWVMIRNYSSDASVTWTPARIGFYTIQIRAKGSNALSYETVKNIDFDITDTSTNKLTATSIIINGAGSVYARTPVNISASVSGPSSEDILYKYIISNGYIYYVETPYTFDSNYIWIPGKSGEYKVSILIKNQDSFGKYDMVETLTVDVQD